MTALPPLAAEVIFHIGNFGVTNTYLNSTLTVVFFLIVGLVVRNKKDDVPHGLQNFLEAIIEFILSYMDQVTGDRKRSLRVLPIVGSLFLFILFSNWLGLVPGVGSIFVNQISNGVTTTIPLFRSANTDLNLTLAMAVLGVILSHILGVGAIGFFRYTNKFIKFGDVFHAGKSLKPMNIFVAFIEFGAGLLEVISEVAKMVSLSLRLFGNIFAGEVLLTVLAGLMAYILPLPFMFLELLVGFIQAVVFAMLVLVYISIATMPLPDHSHTEANTQGHLA